MRLPGAPQETALFALRKLRRDLHDDLGAALAAVATQLELALRTIEGDRAEAARLIERSRGETVAMIGKVRQLAVGRDGAADRPFGAPFDLATVLPTAVTELRSAFGADLELGFDIDPAVSKVREATAIEAFWIVHEAVVNVLKHARARRCWMSVVVKQGEVRLRVRDDGVGFPAGNVPSGTGLTNVRERAEDIGGWCEIRPARPSGALVEASLPI